MKWKMAENSLFAILLRAPWYVSVLVSLGVFGLVRLFLPWSYALFGTLPFIVIALVAIWRQLRRPSASKVAARLEALRAMGWEEFAGVLEAGFRREGFLVKRVSGAADFELEKAGRLSLVCARRWKAAATGVEPLRELVAAGAKREAGECVYVVAGELTANARAFAAEKALRLVEGAALIALAKS
jgi:restriction system protein